MKNKKGLIILSSVIVACAVGLIVSPLVDWPVDESGTSGNIGKSSRFSRKTATESISNMEELVLNDPSYKNSIVTAYVVMQTRAEEFSSLVDMSNEVAGDIPEYENVLDEMNKVYVTVNNVCASLARAGENINATLSGEKRPDLAQNTINASLAYATLQKQNKLATRFIDVTDEYVKTNEASDRLLFVRDQWVDYQLMTAALEGDNKSAKALEKKGTLLPAEKSVATLGSFGLAHQMIVLSSANLANNLQVDNSLVRIVPQAVISNVFASLGNAAYVNNAAQSDNLNMGLVPMEIFEPFRNAIASDLSNSVETQDFFKAIGWDNLNATQAATLNATQEATLNATQAATLNATQAATLNATQAATLNATQAATLNATQAAATLNHGSHILPSVCEFQNVVSSFSAASDVIKANVEANTISNSVLCSQVNDVINSTAAATKATLNFIF